MGRILFSVLLILCAAAPGGAQVTIDYGSRASATAKVIPPGILGTQLGFLQGSGGLNQLKQGGFSSIRINAQLANIYAHGGSNPDWTAIDPTLQSLQSAGLKPLIVMGFTPGWLQPAVTPCPTTVLGVSPYYSAPTDIGRWAQLTVEFVRHVDSAFPGLVRDYEIWNEPDLPSALCVSPDSDTVRRSTYLQMYDAAAPAMRSQAQADGATIRVGGPAFVRLSSTWLNALINDPVASQNLDFVSYHYYLGYTELIAAGLNWDGAGHHPSMLQLTQDPSHGFEATFNSISSLVRAGKQPNPSSTPVYLTEYNDDSAFENDCCRNSPQYSPLFNTMVVSDLLNSVYSGAQNVPGNLTYFAASVDIGSFCLLGIIDPLMDCATTPGTMRPYPQYYAYQMLAAPNFLNLAAGGNMPLSVSIPAPLIGTGFYTSSNNAVVLVNPTGSDVSNLGVTLSNPGNASTSATMYLLNSSHWPPTSQPLALTSSSTSLSASLTVPAFSVVALSVPAQPTPPSFATVVSPQSATISPGQKTQFTLTLTPLAGFNQALSLSCAGVPSNTNCSASPSSVTLDGVNPVTATFTVTTQAASSASLLRSLQPWLAAGLFAFVLSPVVGGRNRSRRYWAVLGGALLLLVLVSCGGGGAGGSSNSPGSPSPSTTPGTPAGSYTLMLTAASGSLSHSTPVTLVVK
jgi:hypothetical protein